jgi:hypothetical protein
MLENLARTFEGNVHTTPAAEELRLESSIGERRMSAIIDASDLEAAKTSTDFHVVLGNEGCEVEALEIDLLSLDLGRDEEMVVEGLNLSTEDGDERIVGGSPHGRFDLHVLVKVDPCRKVESKHEPVHNGLRIDSTTSPTLERNRRIAA